MTLSDVIGQMRKAGCSEKQIDAVVLGLAKAPRSANAERQAKFRETRRNVTVTHVTVTPETIENAEPPRARVDSNLLTKDISGKEVRKKERKEERASRLTTEFVLTDEMREYGRGVGLSDDRLALECANMRDWSLSSPNGVKLDWSATWRQWVRRAVATGPPLNSHRNGKSVHEAVRNLENYVENGGELDELFKIRGDEGRENSIRLLPQGGGGGGGNLRLVGSSGPVEILPLGRREGH